MNTHTHCTNGPFSGTIRVGRYQKGKTNLDFTKARDSELLWHLLGHMQVCTSLQTDNHASTPSLSFLQAGCPSCHPTNSVKALEAPNISMKRGRNDLPVFHLMPLHNGSLFECWLAKIFLDKQSLSECLFDGCIVRGHRLDVGDTSNGYYGHGGRSFTSGRYSNRLTDDETGLVDRTSRRGGPRFNSPGNVPPAADCTRGSGMRLCHPRSSPGGGRFGGMPRYSCSSDGTQQSSAVGGSDSQSRRSQEQVGTSQSASTAREQGLSSR